ncbi:MAG: hypothetical protein WCL16_00750 [bacterium]
MMNRGKFIGVAIIVPMMMAATCLADGVIVVIKNGKVERRDASAGSYTGTVGHSGAVSAATDGEIIVIVYADGKAERYAAKTGSFTGTVGSGNARSCQVTSGVISITYNDGKSLRYDAKTGGYKGTL